ncbi:carboxypeptidase B-like processing protease [Scheffersomyces xylosifermentans]|uniref:carboxypeptidase B-like processing protease n=1 Tax=Scheffersomyces xylosifermentans TaxID=1304137 RepID=UPI00315D0580
MHFLYVLWLLVAEAVFTQALQPKDPSDPQKKYLVTNLPGLYDNIPQDEIPLMFAGQLELYPENNTNYFFWSYKDSHPLPENKKRTIFWLNGGPGCSSMDGALLEAGPFRVGPDEKVLYNNGSWHKAADMIFVDQPGGTGFSYATAFDTELDQVTRDFMVFLEKYYEIFPEDLDNDIYFAGESYAGQYIPYIADGIVRRNRNLTEGQREYKLKGLLIGNGWISPNEQSLSYFPYAVQAGIIDTKNPAWGDILHQHEECQKVVSRIDSHFDGKVHDFEVSSGTCERVLTKMLTATKDDNNMCYNMYDYTKKDTYPSCGMNWPFELKYVGPFLEEDAVVSNLNIQHNQRWEECSRNVGSSLQATNSVPSVHLLPGLLQEMPIVLFNGNLDIICNYIGTEGFIKKLEWGGQVGFSEGVLADWIYNDDVAGYIKSERNLTFVNVFDASHMVPYDKPEISRALIDIITGNFDSKEIETQGDEKKKAIVTYPLGVRRAKIEEDEKIAKAKQEEEEKEKAKQEAEAEAAKAKATATSTEVASSTSESTSVPSGSESAFPEEYEKSTTVNRITRIIQLLVIVVLIWGIYILYMSYKSGPSSIIKTGPSTGRKKNVQWADQLRRFQEDDEEAQNQNQSFLSKTLGKLKGGDSRGTYAPAPDSYQEDIELGEGVTEHTNTSHFEDDNASASADAFLIESEDEEDDLSQHQTPQHDLNSIDVKKELTK